MVLVQTESELKGLVQTASELKASVASLVPSLSSVPSSEWV